MIFITTVHFVIRILMKVKHFHFDMFDVTIGQFEVRFELK